MPDTSSELAKRIVSREQLRESIQNYQRDAFGDILSELLENCPDIDTLKKYARNNPSRWAGMVRTFAALTGYTEKTEATVKNYHLHMHQMSDAELQLELDKVRAIEIESVQNLNKSITHHED